MASIWPPIVLCMNPFIHQASHYPAVRTHPPPPTPSFSTPHHPPRTLPTLHAPPPFPPPPPPPLEIFTIDKPLLVVLSFHITAVPLILTLLRNPWRPKSP